MRTITAIQTKENFLLNVRFDNGTEKVFDMKPYLQLPVFASLNQPAVFEKVVNRGYFIEWVADEIDLSADTLWHEGK